MDLIYTDAKRVDLGVLLSYDLDLAFGVDENNFECTVGEAYNVCAPGAFLYVEGTEYGGIVDEITRDTEYREIIYAGRTWQGILESRIIQPDAGADYLAVSGDANSVISTLIARLGLSDLMTAPDTISGITIDYQMPRYIGGYSGITKMLESVGGKLIVRYSDGMVSLSALPAHDYSSDADFDSDLVDFTAKKSYNTVNHLICLGSGDLKDRTVVHLYADLDGNISQTQTITGLDEYAAVYDYPNAESQEELVNSGIEKLKAMNMQDDLSIDFIDNSEAYNIGDIIGATDNVAKINIKAKVVKKIVNVWDGKVTVRYEVGGLNG